MCSSTDLCSFYYSSEWYNDAEECDHLNPSCCVLVVCSIRNSDGMWKHIHRQRGCDDARAVLYLPALAQPCIIFCAEITNRDDMIQPHFFAWKMTS
mmetsp:Transcript_33653/g.52982  ORF Transcript_33653/g.52982 Transcript_33653/m.52982 type:complete len:96 (-) Transcript_33653:138-425(-)